MSQENLFSYGQRLAHHATTRETGLALVFLPAQGDEQRFSWRDMDDHVNRYARVLMAEGVGQGDVVAFGLRNIPAHIFTTLAIWRLGATTLGLDPSLPAATRDGLIDRIGAKLCIQETAGEGILDRAQLETRAALAAADPLPDLISRPGKIYTSGGSTGLPKLMADDQPYLRQPGRSWGRVAPSLGFRTDQVQLTCAAMSHNAPLTWTQNGIFEGNTTILMERFDAARVIETVARFKVGFLLTVPTMLVRLLDAMPRDAAGVIDATPLQSLHALYHTAAPCPIWLKQEWIDIMGADRVFEMYGSGENTGQTVITGPEWLAHRGSVGRGFETQIRIRDPEDGRLLDPGELGEVFMYPDDIRGRSRYIGKDAAQPRRDADGFQCVGDMGWLDSEGYLYLAGRRDDVINTGGLKVHPERVEAALLAHPEIVDAVVFGTEDRDWGQAVTALIALADPARTEAPADLTRFLTDRLERSELPKRIRVLPALPRDGFGKIRRKALQMAENAALASA
ncbi:AMP-binding protein [Paracoccus laeviglucosivorans]|uniref:Bile acid-coenzyme A ligase n=1 Tax=Paracoccus laeviglucosivorans TaxID=1197861 RepID=A0A521FLX7_9RHOB|nr:AMP-binding protein [Paracoccus laeviglucosivorans]SMO96590.1 bile acid-coenzyme A ligase [Paracoccus laeviglucosivorans]